MAVLINNKMAKTPNVRQIQLPDDIVAELIIQGTRKGFKGFKAYAEHILTEQSMMNELKNLKK